MRVIIKKIKQIRALKAEDDFRKSLYERDKWMVSKFNLPLLSKDELKAIHDTWPFVKPNNDDLIWNRMYKSVHGFDPYYVCDYQVQPIYRALNSAIAVEFLKNKAIIDIYCPELNLAKTYVKCIDGLLYDSNGNIITENDALRILAETDENEFIIKPSVDSGCGKGVKKIVQGGIIPAMHASGSNYVIQECLQQCDFLSLLNPTSINSCRVTSLYIDGSYSMSAILKIGKKGAFIDNWNSSYILGIDDGILMDTAYDDLLNKTAISDTGVKFDGLKYPGYEEIKKHIEKYHKKYFPQLGILGWDVFLDKNGKVRVIEVNPDFPGVVGEQFCSGTFFKKHRDIIIDKILKRKTK